MKLRPFGWRHPGLVGNAPFLLDELLYSIGPDDGSDQMPFVGPRIFLLYCLLSPRGMAELIWSYTTIIYFIFRVFLGWGGGVQDYYYNIKSKN